MKYNGFYYWLFSGQMKHMLAEQYGSKYARDIMKHRQQAIAGGGDFCDYWITGNQEDADHAGQL